MRTVSLKIDRTHSYKKASTGYIHTAIQKLVPLLCQPLAVVLQELKGLLCVESCLEEVGPRFENLGCALRLESHEMISALK